jgi:hypothetical protein
VAGIGGALLHGANDIASLRSSQTRASAMFRGVAKWVGVGQVVDYEQLSWFQERRIAGLASQVPGHQG